MFRLIKYAAKIKLTRKKQIRNKIKIKCKIKLML